MSKMPPAGFLLFLLLFAGCSSVINENEIPVIEVADNLESFENMYLSEITDSIIYIPLETKPGSLTGRIYDLILSKDMIFISDLKSCKVFDKKGKYICDIGERGKGPGQYSRVSSISIDDNNERVYLFSAGSNELLEYSFKGDFLKSICLPKFNDKDIFIDQCYFLDKLNSFCCTVTRHRGNEKNLAYFFNSKSEIITSIPNKYHKLSDGNYHIGSNYLNSPHIFFGNDILYLDNFCDTLFIIDKALNLQPAYIFNFGKYTLPITLFQSKSVFEFASTGNFIFQYYLLVETKDYIFFNCRFNKYYPESESVITAQMNGLTLTVEFARGIFNKNNNELVFARNFNGYYGFINDIDAGVSFWPINNSYKNQLVSTVNPYDLLNLVKSKTFNNNSTVNIEAKNRLKTMTTSLSADDNPVIMIINLKQAE